MVFGVTPTVTTATSLSLARLPSLLLPPVLAKALTVTTATTRLMFSTSPSPAPAPSPVPEVLRGAPRTTTTSRTASAPSVTALSPVSVPLVVATLETAAAVIQATVVPAVIVHGRVTALAHLAEVMMTAPMT